MWLLERPPLNRHALTSLKSQARRAVEEHASEDSAVGPTLIKRAPAMTLSALLGLTSCFCKLPPFHFFTSSAY